MNKMRSKAVAAAVGVQDGSIMTFIIAGILRLHWLE
jgi:hypothetical protein